MTPVLERWNAAPQAPAADEILPCNGARLWAAQLVHQRPFQSDDDLLRAANAVWATLPEGAVQEAFDSHPRLGERKAVTATATSLQWSAGEQSALAQEDGAKAALAAANRVYEERFGRVFLICATGKTTEQILDLLRQRMQNDPATELREAGEQQRRITQLRLRKWLGLPPARCEDV